MTLSSLSSSLVLHKANVTNQYNRYNGNVTVNKHGQYQDPGTKTPACRDQSLKTTKQISVAYCPITMQHLGYRFSTEQHFLMNMRSICVIHNDKVL